MPDDVFRAVITGAVVLCFIAFAVQAAVAIALYRLVQKMQQKVDDVTTAVNPLIGKAGQIMDKATPVVERLGPMVEHLGPGIDRAVVVIGKIGEVAEQAVPIIAGAREVVFNANQIVLDTRPHVAEFSTEAAAAARSAREQVDHLGSLVQDVTGRARARLQQIDQSVEQTVEQVEHVGDAMKRAVLRPVREANGLAAGISAAVSALVHARKSSPDHATQDEEMFI
jgi:methyl-accepting chemotaxis protein